MTNSYKKEYPLAGFPGFGGGVGALSYKSGSTKVYVDDIFSNYLWDGSGSTRSIINGLDLSGEGGMVWIKSRDNAYDHYMVDTERGALNRIRSNSDGGSGSAAQTLTAFNSNGFALGADSINLVVNASNKTYSSWSFRKQEGFFDVVTYTGNATARTISHSLGSIPGLIMIKCTSAAENWVVYHREVGSGSYLRLNTTAATQTDSGGSVLNNGSPTSTTFSVGTHGLTNGNGATYVAYLFAGGESDAATARSVQLDGSGDYFTTSTSSDYAFGTGDFTIECWFNLNADPSNQPHIADNRTDGSYSNQFVLYIDTDYKFKMYKNGNVLETSKVARNTWNHVALVRSSGVTRLYLNGISSGTYTDTNNYSTTSLVFGANAVNFGHDTNGRISNLRIVKGTAVYTSAFKPTYEPLTNITNTKLLCFNNSSVTGSTVAPSATYSIDVSNSGSSAYTLSGTDKNGSVSGNNATVTINTGDTVNFAVNASGHPFYIRVSNGGSNVSTPAATGQGSQSGTVSWTPNTAGTFYYQCGFHSGMIGTITVQDPITASGNPTASTDSPFDDPEGFKFGSGGNQNLIKCGSYVGSGSSGLEVNLGWEPSFVMYKRTDSTGDWIMSDSMRGAPTDGIDSVMLKANDTDSEAEQSYISLTSTGFTLPNTFAFANGSGNTYIYWAIRRPDGYVAKPADAGTAAFTMDVAGSTSPAFDSGFPVDFALVRNPTTTAHWDVGARLIQGKNLRTDSTDAETTYSSNAFDYSSAWLDNTSYSNNQSWMWKRGAGFDVVTYKGDHVDNRELSHSLSEAPEMIWTKVRDTAGENWVVWHSGMPNSGDGENATATALLNLNNAVSHAGGLIYGGTDVKLPTSTHWSVGTHETINDDRYDYISMLFRSVSGISKVGSYSGQNSTITVTTGFSPRFLFVKNISGSGDWWVFDTLRGWGSGNDKSGLRLNLTNAQEEYDDWGGPTSTGFTMINDNSVNGSGYEYIYYAHA